MDYMDVVEHIPMQYTTCVTEAEGTPGSAGDRVESLL
jgi:hypothetical protein